MSEPIEIPLDVDADGHLVDPPIVDMLYAEPATRSFVISFVPEDAVSRKPTEGVEIDVDSEFGDRIRDWLAMLGQFLGFDGAVEKIVHAGGGDFTFHGPTGRTRRLSDADGSSPLTFEAYRALQDIGQTAQIAYLDARRPAPDEHGLLSPRAIIVETRDGRPMRGSVEGNNASWTCRCGYALPLIGTTRPGAGDTRCPNCSRIYRVFPHPHTGARVTAVKELAAHVARI